MHKRAAHALELPLALERHDTAQAAVVAPSDELASHEDRGHARAAGHLGELVAQRVALFAHQVELERRVLGTRAAGVLGSGSGFGCGCESGCGCGYDYSYSSWPPIE